MYVVATSLIHDENMLLQYSGPSFVSNDSHDCIVYPEMEVRVWSLHFGPSFNKLISRLTIDQCFHFLIGTNECFEGFSFVKHKLWRTTKDINILRDPSENYRSFCPIDMEKTPKHRPLVGTCLVSSIAPVNMFSLSKLLYMTWKQLCTCDTWSRPHE